MQDDSMPTNVEDDQNYQFYKEYCRLYYANIILTNRLQQLLNEKKDLQFKLSRLEVRREQRQGLASSLPAVWWALLTCLWPISTHWSTKNRLSPSWLTLSLLLWLYSLIGRPMRRRWGWLLTSQMSAGSASDEQLMKSSDTMCARLKTAPRAMGKWPVYTHFISFVCSSPFLRHLQLWGKS